MSLIKTMPLSALPESVFHKPTPSGLMVIEAIDEFEAIGAGAAVVDVAAIGGNPKAVYQLFRYHLKGRSTTVMLRGDDIYLVRRSAR